MRFLRLGMVVFLLLLAPALVHAQPAPPIPGLTTGQWTVFCELLKTIADARLDGGLSPLMGDLSMLYDRAFPLSRGSRLLWKFAQDFQEIQSLHDEIKSDVEDTKNLVQTVTPWVFSPRTLVLRQLYIEPIDVGRVMLSRFMGDIPPGMPGAYFEDSLGYTIAASHSFISHHANDSSDWSRHFSDMYRRSSDTRRSPGEATRDQAHNLAMKVAVDASNGQLLTQDLTVRTMDAALDESDERSSELVATALYYDMANRPLKLPTDPPIRPFATPTPEPTSTPEPPDNGDSSNNDGDCQSSFRDNVAFGDVMSAIDVWKGQHAGPDAWWHPNGSGQDLVDGEHWDDYYNGVVGILNKNPGLTARVDPCECGEIQVKRRGDNSVSDQYHILTSWGQIRHDQNAYKTTCYPAAF